MLRPSTVVTETNRKRSNKSTQQRRQKRHRRLIIEPLEDRRVLSIVLSPSWEYETPSGYSVAVSETGDYVAIGASDGLHFLDGQGNPLWTYSTANHVIDLAIYADASRIAAVIRGGSSSGSAGPVNVFDQDGNRLSVISGNYSSVSYSPDGEYYAVSYQDFTGWYDQAALWKRGHNWLWTNKTIGGSGSGSVSVAANGITATGARRGGGGPQAGVRVFAESGSLSWTYLIYDGPFADADFSVAFTTDGKYIAAGNNRNPHLHVLDVANKQLLWQYNTGNIQGVAVSADGQYILAGATNTVYLFDISGSLLWTQEIAGVRDVGLSADASKLVVATASGTAYGFDMISDSGDTLATAVDLGILAPDTPVIRHSLIGGSPNGAKDVDLYRFSLGSEATVALEVDAEVIGSSLDAYLRLFDSMGREIASNDDSDGSDPHLSLVLAAGTYYVGVSGFPNRVYDPAHTGSRTASLTTGSYALKLLATSDVPPSETTRTAGQLTIRAAGFSRNVRGQWVTQGDVWINDLIQVEGSLIFDDTTVSGAGRLWMRNLPVLEDVKLYEGDFQFNASQAATDGLNELLSGLKVVGLDVQVGRIWLAEGQVRLQGRIVLPNELGGLHVAVDGSDFIGLSPSEGLTFSGVTISIPDAKDLSLFGIPFQSTGALLRVAASEVQVRGRLVLPSVLGGTTIDLLTDNRHLSITRGDDGRPKLHVVGSLEVDGPILVGPGFELYGLTLQVDTTTREFRGNGSLKVPAGFSIDVGLGFKEGWPDYVSVGVNNLNQPIIVAGGVPVVVWQDVAAYLDHLAPQPPPVVLGGSMRFTAGPEITLGSQSYNLLGLDLTAQYDTAGRFTGTGRVSVGGGEDPFEFASARVIIDKDYGLYADGRMTWGNPDGFLNMGYISLEGALKLGRNRTFQGAFEASVYAPSFPFGGYQLASAQAYAQYIWDSDYSNDYVIVSGRVGPIRRTVSVDLNTGKAYWFAGYTTLQEIHIKPPSGAQAFGLSDLAGPNDSGHELLLPLGLEAALFSVEWDEGDTDVHLVDPVGNVYTPENVDEHPDVAYAKNPEGGEAYYEVFNPPGGTWQLVVINAGGIGSYTIQSRRLTDAPLILLSEPAQDVADGPVTISWTAEPGDMDPTISLYYDTDREGANGILIADDIPAAVGPGEYIWDTAELATGEYYVYAVISDGMNLPGISYGTGRVSVIETDSPAPVDGLAAWAGTETAAELAWEPVTDAEYYLVHLAEDATGEFYRQTFVALDSEWTLTGLVEGDAYRVAVAAVDAEGRKSPKSEPIVVVAGGTYTAVLEEHEWTVFAEPGERYEAQISFDTGELATLVAAPVGASLDQQGLFTWHVPGDADGWYQALIHVVSADGRIRVYRYWLLADAQTPQWHSDAIQGDGISPESVRVEAPRGVDASGVLQYQWERNGTVLPQWQITPILVDAGLQPNSTYEYRARLKDSSPAGHLSEWSSPVSVTTLAQLPDAPVLGASTQSTIVLDSVPFEANPAETEYAIFNATSGEWLAADGTASASPVWQIASNWADCLVSGLDKDTRYVFQAMARNFDLIETDLGPEAIAYTARESEPPTVHTAVYDNEARTLTIEFSEPVVISLKELSVTDSGGQAVDLSSAILTHVPGSSAMVLDLSDVLLLDSYLFVISGATVQDLAGNLLDGDGNGTSGSDFKMPFEVENARPSLTVISPLAGAVGGEPFLISYEFLLAASDASDPDGDAISFRVETVTSGVLTMNGEPVTPGETLLSAAETWVWTPADGPSGIVEAFTVVAWDGELSSSPAVAVQIIVDLTLNGELIDGTLSIVDIHPDGKPNSMTVRLDGPDLVITDANEAFAFVPAGGELSNNDRTLTISLALISSLMIDLAGGDDTLTIDLLDGDIGLPIEFRGGDGIDALVLDGGSTQAVTYTYANSSDGSVTLDPDGHEPLESWTITYSGAALTTSAIASNVVELIYTGEHETIAISDAGNGQTIAASTLGQLTKFTNPTALLRVVATNGTDTIDMGTFPPSYASIQIEGQDAIELVNFHGAIAFAPDHGLTIANVGSVNLPNTTSNITASGNGVVSIAALKNIAFASGAAITSENGDIILSANQAEIPSTGSFVGIWLNGATVSTTGGGAITILGRGGTAVQNNHGVRISSGASVTGGGSGVVNVQGIGGAGANYNYGVWVGGTGSQITSIGADVKIIGQGGNATGAYNYGVYVSATGQITSGGNGVVLVQGTGGTGTERNHGVWVYGPGARISSNAGNVQVTGRGGHSTGNRNYGVFVSEAGEIDSGADGHVTVDGTGGQGTDRSYGVMLQGVGSRISSGGGDVHVVGQGGYGSGERNDGIFVYDRATITSGADGNVSLTGQGGNGPGSSNYGVLVSWAAQISSGGWGTVMIEGTGGSGVEFNYGVRVSSDNARITSGGGNVQVMGYGGNASGNGNYGVAVQSSGEITAGAGGSVKVQGNGGTGTHSNDGVWVTDSGSRISSGGGHIKVIGAAGTGTSSFGIQLETDGGIIGPTEAAGITLSGDSMNLTSSNSVVADGNEVVLRPASVGTLINLGGNDVLTGSPLTLGLTSDELARITAGALTIGARDSGEMRITATVVRTASTDVTLVSGGGIVFDPGSIDTGGGTLMLDPGTAVQPLTVGIDLTASSVSFADGTDLEIEIDGTTVDTEYSQLNVLGIVDLTGASLAFSGSYTPAVGDTFTIVKNDGSAPILGTFAGLPEGAVIPDFLGSGFIARITYAGGDGNDVVLNVEIVETRIGMTVVVEPSDTDNNGEVPELPENEAWVHEWQSFWVEIWVSTPETTTFGVAEARVDLQYQSDYLTAQDIVYESAWDHADVQIDDQANFVTIHGWTERTDLGDNAYVLLARVRLASTGEDDVPVDQASGIIGPYDMQLVLSNGQARVLGAAELAAAALGESPETELWAVVYDIEDNNQIDFGDFSFFAAAFGRTVGDLAAEPPYVWWADFDKSGRVDFGDLAFFAPNFGKTRQAVQAGAQTLVFPANFPDDWRDQAHGGGEGEAVDGAWMLAGSDGPYRSSPATADVTFGPQTTLGTLLQRQDWGMFDTPLWLADAGRESSADETIGGYTRHRLADNRGDRFEVERGDPLEDVLSLLAESKSVKSPLDALAPHDFLFAKLGR